MHPTFPTSRHRLGERVLPHRGGRSSSRGHPTVAVAEQGQGRGIPPSGAGPPLRWEALRQEPRSEGATREWVGAGLDLDLTLLQLVMSDGFQATRFGTYLRALPSHFEGVVVADMFCLLRIELELAVQAKAWLIAHQAGLDLPVDDDLRAALAERAYLQRSIGRTGMLALEPLRVTSHRDYWHRHLLKQSGSRRAWRPRAKRGLFRR